MENILISACLLGVCCRYDGESKPIMQTVALMERYHLVPVCPEQLGGLPTPRMPSEIRDGQVIRRDGVSVDEAYRRGAAEAARLAKLFSCELAVLKARSPSCGCGCIYDGSFTGTLIPGDGVTAALLKQQGLQVITEEELADGEKVPSAVEKG